MQGPACLSQSTLPWSLQSASLAHAECFIRTSLFLVLLASVSMSPSSKSSLPFLCYHNPLSLLHLKSIPEGRIGCLFVCLLTPEPSTCTALAERSHILKERGPDACWKSLRECQDSIGDWPQIPPLMQQVFTEGPQWARCSWAQ